MERTLKSLRGGGWQAEIVERRVGPRGRTNTVDVAGFGDVLAWHPLEGIALVQTTTMDHRSKHVRKVVETPEIRASAERWFKAGGTLIFHFWSIPKATNRWQDNLLWVMDLEELDKWVKDSARFPGGQNPAVAPPTPRPLIRPPG